MIKMIYKVMFTSVQLLLRYIIFETMLNARAIPKVPKIKYPVTLENPNNKYQTTINGNKAVNIMFNAKLILRSLFIVVYLLTFFF